MVVHVEVGQVEVAVGQYHQYLVLVVELAQQSSVLVVVQTVDVGVEPHLAAAQRRVALRLERDAVYGEFRQDVTLRRASLDLDGGKRALQEDAHAGMLLQHRGFERHLDDLGLAVGVGREVEHAAARGALRQVYLAVAGHAGDVESLDEARAGLAVAIHHIIYSALVVLLEHTQPQHVLAYKQLFGHAHHLELTVAVEDDDVVDVGAVAYEFVLLQSCADESFCTVDVELLVGLGHLCSLDGVEVLDLRQTRMVLAVLVLEELEPGGRLLREVSQLVVYLLYLGLDAGHQLVGLVLVELQDALHLNLQQLQYVVLRHLAYQGGVVGRQPFVDMLADGIDVGCLLKLLVLIDALLDEDALQ